MRKRLFFATILVLSSFFVPLNTFADEKLKAAGQDSEGSYIYEFGDYGSFTTNLEEGETAEVAYIEADEALSVTVMKDGAYYESDDFVFYENGSYVLMIYAPGNEEFATFSFKISNNIFRSVDEPTPGEQELINGEIEEGMTSFDFSGESTDEIDLSAMEDFSSLLAGFGPKDSKEVVFDYEYSREYEEILYSFEGKEYFISDIPNNAVVTGDVHVGKVSDFSFYYYYNGEVDFSTDDAVYSEPGTYDFVTYPNLKDGGMGEVHLRFTIIEDVINDIERIDTPEGFEIKKVTKDGFEIEQGDGFVTIDEDGYYSLTYACKDYKGLTYNLAFTKDTTPPELIFDKDIYAKKIKSPISYSFAEPDCTVSVRKDGYDLNIGPDTPLYQGGYYFFTVTDKAGNERTYQFFVKTTYQVGRGELIFLGIFLGMVAIYIFLVRRTSKYGV